MARVERIDSHFAEYNEKHSNQIPVDVVSDFLADKPLSRRNQGKDSIGRLLGASHVSVLNWVRKYGHGLVGIRNFRPCKVMELDEMHSYVGLKNSRWIWSDVDRDANRNTLMWLSGTEVPERDKALVKEQRPSHGYHSG